MARHGGSAGTLRVLHVDDDPAFTRMTAEFLQRADDRFEVLTETDPRVALERLTEDVDAVDCVLSDYQMPAMDGLELLREVRTRFPDGALPFVLLTGRGSEEVAADALNAGATSYVQKGGPDTYEYVARRIREDVQHVRAAQNSAWFFTLVEALDDPVYVLDNEGRFTYVNEAMSELVGYGRAELVGSDPSTIKDEAAVDTAERNLGRILSADGPDSIRFEVTVESKSGDRIPLRGPHGSASVRGRAVPGVGGRPA
jgi:PAS domain S-box-containing protein